MPRVNRAQLLQMNAGQVSTVEVPAPAPAPIDIVRNVVAAASSESPAGTAEVENTNFRGSALDTNTASPGDSPRIDVPSSSVVDLIKSKAESIPAVAPSAPSSAVVDRIRSKAASISALVAAPAATGDVSRPSVDAGGRVKTPAGSSRTMLWVAVALGVLVLVFVVFRLVRRHE